jgi:hypothetical protein
LTPHFTAAGRLQTRQKSGSLRPGRPPAAAMQRGVQNAFLQILILLLTNYLFALVWFISIL